MQLCIVMTFPYVLKTITQTSDIRNPDPAQSIDICCMLRGAFRKEERIKYTKPLRFNT